MAGFALVAASVASAGVGIAQGISEADAAILNAKLGSAAANLSFQERALERTERRIRTIAEIRAANIRGGSRGPTIGQIRHKSFREFDIDKTKLTLQQAIFGANKKAAKKSKIGVIIGGVAGAIPGIIAGAKLKKLNIERP